MVVSKFVYTFLDPFSSLFHAVFFVPTPESGEEHCVRVFFSFFCYFLFSTQNQVPQIIIGIGRVLCHNKTLSVVIRKANNIQ